MKKQPTREEGERKEIKGEKVLFKPRSSSQQGSPHELSLVNGLIPCQAMQLNKVRQSYRVTRDMCRAPGQPSI